MTRKRSRSDGTDGDRDLDDVESKPDYQVGYCKPPVHSRFKPGQSGNPKGPPKGAKSFKSLLERELDATVTIKTERGRRTTTKRHAAAMQVANSAVRGDPKAIKTLMDFESAAADARGPQPGRERQLGEKERTILEKVLARIAEAGAVASAPVDPPQPEIACNGTPVPAADGTPLAAPEASAPSRPEEGEEDVQS